MDLCLLRLSGDFRGDVAMSLVVCSAGNCKRRFICSKDESSESNFFLTVILLKNADKIFHGNKDNQILLRYNVLSKDNALCVDY